MASEYFSHDCDAQFDDKCVRLLQVLGWKGYGVFWGLVERLSKREDCSLEYNPAGLAWQLHVQEKFLVRVITEFNLFTISEDGTRFWSESARRRRSMRSKKFDPTQPKRRPGRPRKYPRPEDEVVSVPATPEPIATSNEEFGNSEQLTASQCESALATSASQTSSNNIPEVREIEPEPQIIETAPQKPQNDVQEQPLSIYQPSKNDDVKPQTSASGDALKRNLTQSFNEQPQNDYEFEVEEAFPATQIIEKWNSLFCGTSQVYRGFNLDAISHQRAKETFESGYQIAEVYRAFEIARDDKFPWLLKDALKPDNVQRLLSKGEKQYAVNSFSGTNIGDCSQAQNEDDPNDWRSDAFWAPYTRLEPEPRGVACCPQ